MAIRLRVIDGTLIAICAARSVAKPGDVYLDDGAHHALADKFAEDFASEGYNTKSLYPEAARKRAQEESNNAGRTWWDSVYGEPTLRKITGSVDSSGDAYEATLCFSNIHIKIDTTLPKDCIAFEGPDGRQVIDIGGASGDPTSRE